MRWIAKEKAVCYADERITVRSTADNSVLFTGIINGLRFTFDFSPDNLTENNTVECSLYGLAECKFYPAHILGSSTEECKGQYSHAFEAESSGVSLDRYSQHTYAFEKKSGEVLFTARLLKVTPANWVETPAGSRREQPPYDLLPAEKMPGRNFGYADNVYLDPLKQLIAAGMKNGGRLTCDPGEWFYSFEGCITEGRLTYPDGRIVIAEDFGEGCQQGRKLFRPGMIIRDYIELDGRKVWYVTHYSDSSNDNLAEATVLFESDYAEDALLRFEGSFIRKSSALSIKIPGRVRGYVAYYQVKGTLSTVGREGGDVSESIDLYKDEGSIEEIAASFSMRERFPETVLCELSGFSANANITAAVKPIELDDLVGLDGVKQTFAEFKIYSEYRQRLSQSSNHADDNGDILLDIYKHKSCMSAAGKADGDTIALHMAFLGSPGTGKTTVAERIAAMLKNFGLVVTNEVPLVVVKSDLVGQHIGETEKIVRKKIDEALNGILFIYEAYTLFESSSDRDYGRVALDEIMYAMEKHGDKLVVILAGYTQELLNMLKHANPGLTSRIPWYFYFSDYSPDEMWEILNRMVEKSGYRFEERSTETIKSKVIDYFASLKKKLDGIEEAGKTVYLFGNGRGVRTFFQYMQIGLAARLAGNDDGCSDLRTFTTEDADFAYAKFEKGSESLKERERSRIGFQ